MSSPFSWSCASDAFVCLALLRTLIIPFPHLCVEYCVLNFWWLGFPSCLLPLFAFYRSYTPTLIYSILNTVKTLNPRLPYRGWRGTLSSGQSFLLLFILVPWIYSRLYLLILLILGLTDSEAASVYSSALAEPYSLYTRRLSIPSKACENFGCIPQKTDSSLLFSCGLVMCIT